MNFIPFILIAIVISVSIISSKYIKKIRRQSGNLSAELIAKIYRIRNFARAFGYLVLYGVFVLLIMGKSPGESIFSILLLALLVVVFKTWYLIIVEFYFAIMLRKREEESLAQIEN